MPDVFAQITKSDEDCLSNAMQEQEQSKRHQEITNYGLFGLWRDCRQNSTICKKDRIHTSKTLPHSEPCDPADSQ